jgi:hypothetical protein
VIPLTRRGGHKPQVDELAQAASLLRGWSLLAIRSIGRSAAIDLLHEEAADIRQPVKSRLSESPPGKSADRPPRSSHR